MMDYKKMAEIVAREVEIKEQRKMKRIATIKRVSLTVSGLCAAIIVCLGVWNNDKLKNVLNSDLLVQPTDNVIIDSTAVPDADVNDTSSVPKVTATDADTNNIITVTTEATNQSATNNPVTQPVTTGENNVTTESPETLPSVTETVVTPVSPVTTTAPKQTTPPKISSTVDPPPDRPPTTTTVTGNTDPNFYGFYISFLDDNSFEAVNSINARLIQQKIEWIDDVTYADVGDGIVVAEWNSSDFTSYYANFIKEETEYRYIVVVDTLPSEYSFSGQNFIEYNISGYFEGYRNIDILLSKEQEPVNSIPLEGTYSLRLKVLDIISNVSIQNLECELYCIQTKEVVASWNTSTTEELYIENLRYSFDSPDSYNGNITYAIRITNLPENYRFFYGKSREFYGISGFGLEEFSNGTDLICVAYLEDTSEEAPKYNYN
ncbi:MAG: hypothetical protein IKI94_04860 [Ruminococcus sp.]|nr:hypothetical protein [Ruminococcus sp.]